MTTGFELEVFGSPGTGLLFRTRGYPPPHGARPPTPGHPVRDYTIVVRFRAIEKEGKKRKGDVGREGGIVLCYFVMKFSFDYPSGESEMLDHTDTKNSF